MRQLALLLIGCALADRTRLEFTIREPCVLDASDSANVTLDVALFLASDAFIRADDRSLSLCFARPQEQMELGCVPFLPGKVWALQGFGAGVHLLEAALVRPSRHGDVVVRAHTAFHCSTAPFVRLRSSLRAATDSSSLLQG